MNLVEKYTLTFEARLGDTDVPDLAGVVMEALVESDAEFPLVLTDIGDMMDGRRFRLIRVEVVIEASSKIEAIGRGGDLIAQTFEGAGVGFPVPNSIDAHQGLPLPDMQRRAKPWGWIGQPAAPP